MGRGVSHERIERVQYGIPNLIRSRSGVFLHNGSQSIFAKFLASGIRSLNDAE